MRKNTGMLFRAAGIILLILTGCNQGGDEGTFTVGIEKESVAENIGVEEESRTEKIKIPKNWTKQTKTFSDSELNDTQISQYTDESGNVAGYEVVQGENKFAYSLEHTEYQFKEMQGEIPRYHWNNDEEFLYEAVLSEEDDEYGMFVGYSFNLRNWQRDYGDSTDIVWVDNRIGVKADSIINDGMKMNIVLYERHRSELDEGYDHIVATAQYLICLKEKVIIVE
ncbi:MAG: hypothetical protein ACI4V0_10895 [Lachnospiraceae bacterium]